MALRWYQQARYMLVLLVIIFVVPMVLAWFMVSHRMIWGTVNHGYLMQPRIDLSALAIRTEQGKPWKGWYPTWWLVYKPKAQCDQLCMDQLHLIHQINIALGKNRMQLRRALLMASSSGDLGAKQRQQIDEVAAATHVWRVHQAAWQLAVMAKMPKKLAFKGDALYLVDPEGSIVLAYAADVPGKAVLHDLNRLLKVSKYHVKK